VVTASRGTLILAILASLLSGSTLATAAKSGPAGRLDRSFSRDGKALTDFGSQEDWANDVAVQRDGKTVAVGIATPGGDGPDPAADHMFAVARYTARGRLDSRFGGDGRATVNLYPDPTGQVYDFESAEAVAVQPDGKIVVAGSARSGAEGSARDVFIVRLTRGGHLDGGFGDGGKVRTQVVCDPTLCPSESVNDVIVQPDGRILAGGCFPCDGGGVQFLMLRYLPDGRLDPGFGQGGVVVTDPTDGLDSIAEMALLRDGRIVALSHSFDVVRYHADGRVDDTFAQGGVAAGDLGYLSGSSALAVQRDGKLLLGGQVYDPDSVAVHEFRGPWDVALVRLGRGGGLDPTFGRDGIVVTDVGGSIYCEEDHATSVKVQRDGRILASGNACTPGPDFFVLRYRPSGRLDRRFSGDGKVLADLGGGEFANASMLRSGTLVVAGSGGQNVDFALARFVD
jgi:uncharacterized delta-60 repeat protein